MDIKLYLRTKGWSQSKLQGNPGLKSQSSGYGPVLQWWIALTLCINSSFIPLKLQWEPVVRWILKRCSSHEDGDGSNRKFRSIFRLFLICACYWIFYLTVIKMVNFMCILWQNLIKHFKNINWLSRYHKTSCGELHTPPPWVVWNKRVCFMFAISAVSGDALQAILGDQTDRTGSVPRGTLSIVRLYK